jgi:hypothetical protein
MLWLPEAVFVGNAYGSIALRRLPKLRPDEIAKLVEWIARRTLALPLPELKPTFGDA